ncbi:hypothetical protein [Aureibaculum conchae]|uniref:hypothetical protein n=1 Tax=Aureibaculum sp. 2308TA14-22 TaxID=3108392 RepID=UPI00339B6180
MKILMFNRLLKKNMMLIIIIFLVSCNKTKDTLAVNQVDIKIYLNQSGFDSEWPKRFTTSDLSDGTKFTLHASDNEKQLYEGIIKNSIGDFSDFQPKNANKEYFIKIGSVKSDIFRIAPYLMFYTSYKPALQFMIDSRSVIGTHNSAYGGCPWRDGTYYSFEMPSLVMLYLSNPNYFENIVPEINYDTDKKRVLSKDFRITDEPNDDEALETARKYYTDLETLIGDDVPDIIRLIHWGVGWYLLDPDSHDPSGDPKGNKIHDQTIEQFAFFLYGYPTYKKYIPEAFYKKALTFTIEQWKKTNLFDVKTEIGSFKGRETPGHSILPNLLMYEVAKREGLNEQRYLQAAIDQTNWIIDSLNLNDPISTKGQRMSEYKLYTSLTTFYNQFNELAPKSLKEYLDKYADIIISRSNNKWDFRKYNDSLWSIPRHGNKLPKSHPGWNEPGNIAAFPALAYELSHIVENKQKRKRLKTLAVSHFDNLFGRNPVSAHSANRGVQDYEGVERGWPKEYKKDVCARLELVRGTLSSSAATEHYVNGVKDDFRWPEGWVNFNAAFNVGLAYASLHNMQFEIQDNTGTNMQEIIFDKSYDVVFKAPVSLNNQQRTTLKVDLYNGEEFVSSITLKETEPGSSIYKSTLKFSLKSSTLPNTIQLEGDSNLSLKYGYGVFGKRLDIKVKRI